VEDWVTLVGVTRAMMMNPDVLSAFKASVLLHVASWTAAAAAVSSVSVTDMVDVNTSSVCTLNVSCTSS
jgi:hypothetical protein